MQAELIDTGSLERAIEAVLFVAAESVSIKTLAKLTGADEADVTVALQAIDAGYASRGIVLREVAGGYRFATSPSARAVVEAYLMPPKTNLSPAALETLAIVAYMQPVTKGDIEGIRGVSADSVLSTLVDRRFLAEAGRKDVAGRPILYKTTPDFLEAFGLRSLEELPPIDIDADAPIELAFPISLQAVESASSGEPAGVAEPTNDSPESSGARAVARTDAQVAPAVSVDPAGVPDVPDDATARLPANDAQARLNGAVESPDRANETRPDRTAAGRVNGESDDPAREASGAASAAATDAERGATVGGDDAGPTAMVRTDDDRPTTNFEESENVLAP